MTDYLIRLAIIDHYGERCHARTQKWGAANRKGAGVALYLLVQTPSGSGLDVSA